MPELHALCDEQQHKDGHDEHRLELEGEGAGHRRHAEGRFPGHAPVEREQGEGDIDAVALAPDGAVERHGGPEEHGEVDEEQPHPAAGEEPGQTHGPEGKQHVEKGGKQLYKIEVVRPEIGEEREEVEVRHIVVAHRTGERGEAPVIPEVLYPAGEEVLIVQRLAAEKERPDGEGQGHEPRADEHMRRLFEQPVEIQQQQGQPRLQKQQNEC